MTKEQAIMVHRLEVCLSDIRKIAGWKGVELGNMLGLSRQAISTLEKQNSRLTFAQYIAIRHLIDEWMIIHPENKTLPRVINLLLDDRRIFGKYYDDLRSIVSIIAAAAAGGASQEDTDGVAKALLDNWEGPAREYCYKQLENKMLVEMLGVTMNEEPANWTELIIKRRNTNGKERTKRND